MAASIRSSIFLNILRWIFALNLLGTVYSQTDGKLLLLHSPQYLKFDEAQPESFPLPSSDLSRFGAAVLGVSSQQELRWKAFRTTSPFKRPEAFALVTVQGPLYWSLSNKESSSNIIKPQMTFPIFHDSADQFDLEELTNKLQMQPLTQPPLLVSVTNGYCRECFQYTSVFHDLPTSDNDFNKLLSNKQSVFDMSNSHDFAFLKQIEQMNAISQQLAVHKSAVRDGSPDVFTFTLSGVNALGALDTPQKVKKAEHLLEDAIKKLSESLTAVYGDDFMLSVAYVSDHSPFMARHKRATGDKGAESDKPNINLAHQYDPQYPVAFNIIFWMSVILVIALFSIACNMWNMDPGRDTIIYRMTSQRLKKDA